ncbi:MAG: hypothetical protein ACREAB_15530, partial [Blastocatellia bacterium]
ARNLPDHSAVNHPLSSDNRFDTLPLSVIDFRSLPERSGFRLCYVHLDIGPMGRFHRLFEHL